MNVMRYLREVRAETAKVSWPNMRSTRLMTLGVTLLAFFVGAYLWFVDLGLSSIVEWIIGVK
ncbi:MAG: preprotein translocase subunit SecE [Magnetococcales bacterium]|nr:preprotein translocase subunit SecE [Magnetococcales bacterium]PPR18957.1 MAG: Protein translocase subunit SecE [Pseudomonadota bacterium]